MKCRNFLLIFLLLSLIIPFVNAQIPDNLLVIQQYNTEQAKSFLIDVSFLIAFLAGILTLLSPCILPLIPAFFSYTFKEKRQITYMTLVFFAGFTVMFITMGILATIIGNASLVVLQENYSLFIQIAGIAMIVFGLMSFFGKGFSGLVRHKNTGHDTIGVFLYGIFFALGWTICTGPILAGVLSMASLFHNYFTAGIFMLFYSFGVFVPLFLFSFFYDSHHLEKLKWMNGKTYSFRLFGRNRDVHISNIISGIMFVILGLLFVFYKGTAVVNKFSLFGLKNFFYVFQRYLINGSWWFNILGLLVLAFVIYLIYKALTAAKEGV
ncbi:hypothetical protein COV16_05285 [Candidatus Woesearchaeota archaeon CG10_big_fil_rev_8_21_14_0_10_34_8]|nr:MAG: hypothetical protein COV16_05285 [Candidatus Woesearchaeota archaeon CG10_big_fil_rev_8_21_14_0_10_34_8]